MSLKPSQWEKTQMLVDLDDPTVSEKTLAREAAHQTAMEGNDI